MTADDLKAAVLKYVRKQKRAALHDADAAAAGEYHWLLKVRATAFKEVEHFLKTFNTSTEVE